MDDYSENALVEQPAIALFTELGYETVNGYAERLGEKGTLGREHRGEVVLVRQLRAALGRLNPGVGAAGIEAAVEALTRDRSALNPAHANREAAELLRGGVKVAVRDERGEEATETVRVVDWVDPEANDFLLVSQFWVAGEIYTRRPDLVVFVNGLPLAVFELKAAGEPVKDAFAKNIRDYKSTIPQLFWFNAFLVASNGGESRIGTVTAGWEHFGEWKRIDEEGERGVVSLETLIRGTCAKGRLLDLVENFALFTDAAGAPAKVLAKNHQYLGVNNAFAAMERLAENRGRLGVFWHTQGSGKSYSMLFFARKVLRKLRGDWTFVIVTDRDDLDKQIYKTFAGAGAVRDEEEVHAESGEHLRRLLRENHRYVFTLIQKFGTKPGTLFPELSTRSDIVVITDEAHRSQYLTLASNMRRALPNAAFIAFTGTPLISVDAEKTAEVFGDYVSVYDFRQSMDDGATVPLYYENRVPEVQLTNDRLNDDLAAVIEAAALDEDGERALERQFAREYQLITRDERLDRIARDIVEHYLARFGAEGERVGKAMVVSVDKLTAIRMWEKVGAEWDRRLGELRQAAGGEAGRDGGRLIRFMEGMVRAVVVSQGQNEVEEFARKGFDILPHRKLMVQSSPTLEERFKNADDPFRMVFVTAMWMTGFDVPSLSTIYLDKPLRNHTLMQTIARANRVFGEKSNGLIVDYIGIFRNLEQALAIYGSGAGGSARGGELPVQRKEALVGKLAETIAELDAFVRARGVEPETIQTATGFTRIAKRNDATDALVAGDETKKAFLARAGATALLHRAILPDKMAQAFAGRTALYAALAREIRSLTPAPDVDEVLREIEAVLDGSIATEGYVIREAPEANLIDIGALDFEALRRRFAQGRQHIEVERLRGAIERELERMVRLNKTRMDYHRRFQELIDEYNAGARNVQLVFEELLGLAQALSEEERRAAASGMTEEELALFDLLTKPGPRLTAKEEDRSKRWRGSCWRR